MIIAFHAEGRQSGKDTAGRFLADWAADSGVPYERRAFGDKMKLLVAEALGIRGQTNEERIALVDRFKLYGDLSLQTYEYDRETDTDCGMSAVISGREFIINLAGDSDDTGARGLFGASFWVDQCLDYGNYDPIANRGIVVGITDLRFDVEADRVHELGGAVVKIDREGTEKGRSEQGINPIKIDYHIDNNKSLDDLHVAVWRIAGSEWQNR